MKNSNQDLQNLYSEMALSNMQKIGKWDDKKNRHGYDKASIGILSSPAGLKKLEQKFNNIGNWDFNLYFVKLPNAWKNAEMGKVDIERLPDILGIEAGKDFPIPSDDDITIIFTNNAAAERIPLTPWLIAHRIGHSFAATFRRGQDHSSEYYHKEIDKTLRYIFESFYGKKFEHRNLIYSSDPLVRNFLESIGKFRSARMKQIPRTGEFIYEAFAQYLLSDGKLSFNPLPEKLIDSNKKAWGNPTGRNYRLLDWVRENPEDGEELLDRLANKFEQLFDYYLNSHIGAVSIM
jgi:hypothetical protein